jgi:hypothetical protein
LVLMVVLAAPAVPAGRQTAAEWFQFLHIETRAVGRHVRVWWHFATFIEREREIQMQNEKKELASIRSCVQQLVEEGKLEPWAMHDVERGLLEVKNASKVDDYHLVMVVVGEIARKLQR